MRIVHLPKVIVRTGAATAIATMLGAATPPATQGIQLKQDDGVFIDLGGGATAFTYWTDKPDGYHVVTTVDSVRHEVHGADKEERHSVIRFSAVLWPGQTQTISVPGLNGSAPPSMRIQRNGDAVVISSSCEGQS
jgi:hypothetical protein